ncbi:MAG TPA: TIGR03364 family FAD-dependent oxidoreductase [Fimbriimonas sp.]|nr:TIGR03364 family FAD-dependent oxidoreductase [Fimbriimonas sp.]
MKFDVAIVGSGILGLAHAYHLSKAGLKVAVFERNARPVGASIRNFGMIWPIGQPPGEIRQIALESRGYWLEMLHDAGIWHRECGSLHLAYAPDELGVLEQFVALAPEYGYGCEMISADGAQNKSPVVRREGLRGAMWSPDELCVDPRVVLGDLPSFLHSRYGVEFYFSSPVTAIESGRVEAVGREFEADWILCCPGDDLRTLFTELLEQEDIRLCKLQMMRAVPKSGFKIGPHLCAGLTLAHYANFQICDHLEALKARFQDEYPEETKWGIHLLVSQNEQGVLTIGDSHEYVETADPFLKEEIDRLILNYLDTFLPIDQIKVVERWHGVYAKHFDKPYALLRPFERVGILAGVGGTGMTLAFGLAARVIEQLGVISQVQRP